MHRRSAILPSLQTLGFHCRERKNGTLQILFNVTLAEHGINPLTLLH